MNLREICKLGTIAISFRAAAQRRRPRPVRDKIELARVGLRIKSILKPRPITPEMIVETIQLVWAYLSGKDV